jgi:hypothetical protein
MIFPYLFNYFLSAKEKLCDNADLLANDNHLLPILDVALFTHYFYIGLSLKTTVKTTYITAK